MIICNFCLRVRLCFSYCFRYLVFYFFVFFIFDVDCVLDGFFCVIDDNIILYMFSLFKMMRLMYGLIVLFIIEIDRCEYSMGVMLLIDVKIC